MVKLESGLLESEHKKKVKEKELRGKELLHQQENHKFDLLSLEGEHAEMISDIIKEQTQHKLDLAQDFHEKKKLQEELSYQEEVERIFEQLETYEERNKAIEDLQKTHNENLYNIGLEKLEQELALIEEGEMLKAEKELEILEYKNQRVLELEEEAQKEREDSQKKADKKLKEDNKKKEEADKKIIQARRSFNNDINLSLIHI